MRFVPVGRAELQVGGIRPVPVSSQDARPPRSCASAVVLRSRRGEVRVLGDGTAATPLVVLHDGESLAA